MIFEWDENKNEINKRKHKVSFEQASDVFNDENRLEEWDYLHSDDEDRYDVIGMADDILFVVCVYRTEDAIRIISARKANKQERMRYYGNC